MSMIVSTAGAPTVIRFPSTMASVSTSLIDM